MKVSNSKADDKLIAILEEINATSADSAHSILIRERRHLIPLTAKRLAYAIEALVHRGTEIKLIANKIELYMELLIDPMKHVHEFIPDFHIIKKLIAEHRQVEYLLGEIQLLGNKFKGISYLTATNPEFKKLIHIASHIDASSKHTDVEEQIIFPGLEKNGFITISKILRAQHFEVRHYGEQLHELAFTCSIKGPSTIADQFNEIASRLIPLKKKHMLIEERLVYPIALTIVKPYTWDSLKSQCERVGFCCF
jgi:DUF438 domain-containing protein